MPRLWADSAPVLQALLCVLRKGRPMKPGHYIRLALFDHYERVRILAIHRGGTIDVLRYDGRQFRVSGFYKGKL